MAIVISRIEERVIIRLYILLFYIIKLGEMAERDAFSLKLKRGRFKSFFLLGPSPVYANIEKQSDNVNKVSVSCCGFKAKVVVVREVKGN